MKKPKWLSVMYSWLITPVGINWKNHWRHDAGYCFCVVLGFEFKRYDSYGRCRGLFLEFTILNFGIEFYIAKKISYTEMFGLPENDIPNSISIKLSPPEGKVINGAPVSPYWPEDTADDEVACSNGITPAGEAYFEVKEGKGGFLFVGREGVRLGKLIAAKRKKERANRPIEQS